MTRTNIPQSAEVRRYINQSRAKVAGFRRSEERKRIEARLLSADPHCAHCGRLLRPEAGFEDSAHLVIDRLSCCDDVRIVRAYALAESSESVVSVSIGGEA